MGRSGRLHPITCRQKRWPTALICSRSTVDDYVRRGLLPTPRIIGNLQRWRWSEIEAWIANQGAARDQLLSPNADADEEDPYSLGVKRVTASDT